MKFSTDLYPELKSPQDTIDVLASLQTPVTIYTEIAKVFQLCRYMLKGHRAHISCEFDDAYKHMCVIRATANSITFDDSAWLSTIIDVSSNVKFFCNERGRTTMEITFFGIKGE